ncbi:MAG TPA: hypothetical protein VKP64_05580 [Mycobacteriales bacterium]|nr:hypothetical protein [Mycobacteriales bacterium]
MSGIRKAAGVALVAVPAGALGVAALTSASSGSAASTIQVTTKAVQSTHLDLGTRGLSQGDQMIFAEDVFLAGKKIGTDGGVCTVTRVLSGSAHETQCLVSATLPKGQLTFQGLFNTSQKTVRLAITGGTGAYRDTGGYVTFPHTMSATTTATLFLDHLKR